MNRALAFALLCCALPATAQRVANLSADGPHAVQVFEFAELRDPSRNRRIPLKLHLPAAEGRLPVVVVSHGGGGHWDANFAQARHLATRGYAVLAIEHVGSSTEVLKESSRWGQALRAMTRDAAEVLGRPRDVSFAIDRAREWSDAHPQLRGRLATERVAVLGHSFGAYTALVLAGMRPALDWLQPPQGRGLGPDLRDPRVACAVALSPQGPGEPFFIEPSFASLAIPLLAITGSRDEQQGAPPENRRRAFELWPKGSVTFVWLVGADHMAFSDSTGTDRRMLPSRTRADVQPLVRAATLLFLEACLRRDPGAEARLTHEGLEPFLRGRVLEMEVLKK